MSGAVRTGTKAGVRWLHATAGGWVLSNLPAAFVDLMRCSLQRAAVAMITLAIVSGVLVAAMSVAGPVHALSPQEQLKDSALEARARELSAELRCLVCQNQSIDDSDAPLAKDLRRIVRERLVAGDSNKEIKSYLVARFGDFVLLKPPFNWHTLILWLTPVLVLTATLGYVAAATRRRRAGQGVGAVASGGAAGAGGGGLTADEEARLAALMASKGDGNGSDDAAGTAGTSPKAKGKKRA